MHNETPVRVPKKSRLKWVCGGCLGVVLLLVSIAALSWRFLAGREPGVSAWENLPPSIAAAVEARDLGGLLEYTAEDKGMASVAAAFAESFAKRMNAASGGAGGAASPRVSLADWSFLLPYAFPDSVIFGMGHDGSPILIARLPAWIEWLIDAGSGGAVELVYDKQYCLAHKDGWLLAATKPDFIQETIDNWEKRAKPLGVSPAGKTPLVTAAGRTSPGAAAGVGTPPASPESRRQPRLLALSDPFAANQAAHPAGDMAWKIVILPENGTWKIDGSADLAASATDMDAFFAAAAGEPPAYPVQPPPTENADVAARLLAPPWLLRKWLHFLIQPETISAAGNGLIPELHNLLFNVWLEYSAGECVLSARKPAVPPDPDLPPMPVMAAGWRLAYGSDRIAVAEKFASSIHAMIDALRNDDSGIVRAVGESIVSAALPGTDGAGETLAIPPVLLNSAQPAWLFPLAGEAACGWIASDPAGVRNPPAFDGPEPLVMNGTVLGSALWNVSEDFRLSAITLLRDRLETIPDGMAGDKEKTASVLSSVNDILAAYPRGSLHCRAEDKTGRITFTASIPFSER